MGPKEQAFRFSTSLDHVDGRLCELYEVKLLYNVALHFATSSSRKSLFQFPKCIRCEPHVALLTTLNARLDFAESELIMLLSVSRMRFALSSIVNVCLLDQLMEIVWVLFVSARQEVLHDPK